jgi:DNA-binding GntR family transcriptional regulator
MNRPPARRRALTDDDIAERLSAAILEHRLPPGTKLGEDRLAETFGVSRTRIRQVLFRLAGDKVVKQIANRGAFVAEPTVDEARDVFDARAVIEPQLAARVAGRARAADVARLREHVGREHAAREAADRRAQIKLSGEFHTLLAEMAGNAVLGAMLRELIARSSLIIALYGARGGSDCGADEHQRLVEAVRRRDAALAAKLMHEHLAHVERTLDLDTRPRAELDLRAVLLET